jgi:hypothetical protein
VTKFNMYAIYNEDEDYWFNVELEGWVEQFELEGDCLFPTYEMAQKYIEDVVQDENAKVYKVELLTTGSYEYEPVHLPCVSE